MGELDLEQALAAACRGEEWGVNLLFRALQPQLLRYLGQHAPRREQDLASETWLAVAERLASFEGSLSDFRALVFTIARRRLVDHYRQEGRRLRPLPMEQEAEVADPEQGPEGVVEVLSAREAVAALVGSLPPAQAEVLLLRVVADLGVEEVAAVMGRSAAAVRVLQHRALRQLAKRFAGEGVTK